MKLRQVEELHAILQTGSVTGAAKLLNVSQPSVSTVPQHLEAQLGMVPTTTKSWPPKSKVNTMAAVSGFHWRGLLFCSSPPPLSASFWHSCCLSPPIWCCAPRWDGFVALSTPRPAWASWLPLATT